MKLEMCERCEGSGVDPLQAYRDDTIVLCSECSGDGCHRFPDLLDEELRLTA